MPEEDEDELSMDLPAVKRRIAEIVRVLDNFSALRDSARGRSEYIQQLKKDCMTYYGYNSFMIDVFFNLFPPAGAKFLSVYVFCNYSPVVALGSSPIDSTLVMYVSKL